MGNSAEMRTEEQHLTNNGPSSIGTFADSRATLESFIPEEFYHLGIVDCWKKSKGEGAVIGLLDTGIDLTNAEINHHLVGSMDCINIGGDGQDKSGHGTHSASRICASRNESPPVGIAPLCSMYNVKVLNQSGSGSSETVMRGLDACLRKEVDIVLHGISGPYSEISHDLLRECVGAGILPIGAKGLDDNMSGHYEEMLYVAPFYSDYTNIKCDLIAPSFYLYTAEIGGEEYRFRRVESWEVVAGIALLVKAYHPDWDGLQVRRHLIDRATWIPGFKAPMVSAVNILE